MTLLRGGCALFTDASKGEARWAATPNQIRLRPGRSTSQFIRAHAPAPAAEAGPASINDEFRSSRRLTPGLLGSSLPAPKGARGIKSIKDTTLPAGFIDLHITLSADWGDVGWKKKTAGVKVTPPKITSGVHHLNAGLRSWLDYNGGKHGPGPALHGCQRTHRVLMRADYGRYMLITRAGTAHHLAAQAVRCSSTPTAKCRWFQQSSRALFQGGPTRTRAHKL